MPLSTSAFLRGSALLLTVLGCSSGAWAQTAPTWQAAYNMGTGSQYATMIGVDAAGNTYEVGGFTNTTTIGTTTLTSLGNVDGYLAKYAPDGTVAWVRQLGSPGNDLAVALALDAAGNPYITGNFSGTISLGNGLTLEDGASTTGKSFVVRYTPDGTPTWARQSVPSTRTNGGNDLDLDDQGHVVVSGIYSSSLSIGSTNITYPGPMGTPGSFGTYLARFDAATGELQSLTPSVFYVPAAGTTSATYAAPRVTVAPTGEMYLLTVFTQPAVVGSTTFTTRGENDILLVKYDAAGTPQWARQLGGPAADYNGEGLVDAAGNLYLAGGFTGEANFDGKTVTSAGNFDGFLLRYSPEGSLQWVSTSGGPGSDGWSGLALDEAGYPYLSGNFAETAHLGTSTVTSAGSRDALVAAYTPQGQVRWTQQAGGTGFDNARQLGFDANGILHVLGSFEGTSAFGTLSLSTGARTTFLAQLGGTALAVHPSQTTQLSAYPNPAYHVVHLPGLPTGTSVRFVDALGRLAYQAPISATGQVAVMGLKPGLYTLRATDALGRRYTSRVQVQ
ncbi:T9SS type A sorting domain-containing protein [Hymenobacter sp. BT18]|uniref:SBBP repeat-containing protein n=1 Tax=Hymenobacter sp. BT18 TaxID=2835648 RepID=UPI00143ECE03|nr:SBBP repeat-containing protein [Hymenobacter sp. BT18]QIX63162.1 T9SS type A sorting domain-containing protein [Hymenobacter sp. BT18]